jgi:hypothetical protein
MGCWHGYGHGCGPGPYYWPAHRGYYGPAYEDDWYEDVNWPMRRRGRARSGDPELRAAALEERLEELRDELQRVEAALEGLARPASGAASK